MLRQDGILALPRVNRLTVLDREALEDLAEGDDGL